MRPEEWCLDLAAGALRTIDAVAYLADAVGARLTTADDVRRALDARTRVPRRRFLASVIDDVASGTCSTLEHGYLTRVERPHGLPAATRQFAESIGGPLFRDVVYPAFGVIIELDGRLHHTRTAGFDNDLERDLDALATDRLTGRLGWGQVFDRPCTTARKVGLVLNRRGWDGQVLPCSACPVG